MAKAKNTPRETNLRMEDFMAGCFSIDMDVLCANIIA